MDYWTGLKTITLRGTRHWFSRTNNKGVDNPVYESENRIPGGVDRISSTNNIGVDNPGYQNEDWITGDGDRFRSTNNIGVDNPGYQSQNWINGDEDRKQEGSRDEAIQSDRTEPNNESQHVIDIDSVPAARSNPSETVVDVENKPDSTGSKDSTRNTTNGTDKKWLKHIEKKFRKSVDSGGKITIDTFTQTLGLTRDFLCERVFELFDRDGVGTITINQLMAQLERLANGTQEDALKFLFNVFDSDGDGKITRDGLQQVLQACIEDSALSLAAEQIEDLTEVLFDMEEEGDSYTITFYQFSQQLDQFPLVKENLSISVANWLKHKEAPRNAGRCPRHFSTRYIRNHFKKLVYFCLYFIVNVSLFWTTYDYHRDDNVWIQIARGCGQCLNFNCMWILVLMLRKSMTYLRSSRIRHLLPLDQYIIFHKVTGYAIVIFSIGHIAAHIANAAAMADVGTMHMWEVLFTTKAQMGHGIFTGSAYFTGWLLVILLIPMVFSSLSFIRRTGYFEIFYLVHLLYIPFWILVMMHGSNFWKWFAVPGAIFLIEKVSRSKVLKKAQYGDVWIEEVNLLPSRVTHLVISRPEKFNFRSGDYINIQIPAIAKHEWHPFTISSAPEMQGKIWLHVRSVGNWTNKLYEYFEQIEGTSYGSNVYYVDGSEMGRSCLSNTYSRRSSVLRSSKYGTKIKAKHKAVNVKCYIDGPYGTGGRELLKSEHAVLVGAGIGVTPMASILQSVWYRLNESKIQCPSCQKIWFHERSTNEMKLKKVDFIWVNRDQKSFEWFLTLMNELELQASFLGPTKNAIQTHLYMTSAKKGTDLKGIGLQMALDLVHEKNNKDLITGLRAKTNPGRPDWDEVFQRIKAERQGRVHVYFCGPPVLGKALKEAALKYNFDFSKETF